MKWLFLLVLLATPVRADDPPPPPPPAPPTTFFNTGAIPTDGNFVTHTFTVDPSTVKWAKITIGTINAAANTFLDLDTETSTALNTAICLYKTDGTIVGQDTVDGSDNLSQLTFGKGTRLGVGNSNLYNGRDGATLAAGDYFVAVTKNPVTFQGGWQAVSTSADLGEVVLRVRSGTQPLPSIAEIEPNSNKATATPATLLAGDAISGSSAGSSTDPTGTGISTVDYFLVTLPQQSGIWRHRLTLTTTGTVGHAISLRAQTQTGGVLNIGTDTTAQTSSGATNPPRFVQCYSFGDAIPRCYLRVTGIGSTGAPYRVALACERVTPVRIPRSVLPGDVTFTTYGQSTADTELLVLDSAYNLLPGFHNDDTPAGPLTPARVQSTLRRPITPGIYYVGVTDFDAATADPSPADDANRSGPALDFPGLACTSSTLASLPMGLTITGGNGTPQNSPISSSTKTGPFDILWFRVRVACNPADVARLGGTLQPDGQITADDLIAFLAAFFAEDLDGADIATLGGDTASDGRITPDDIIAFLGVYFSGCP